jgi:nucleotide-binding universal stress UspA family protein
VSGVGRVIVGASGSPGSLQALRYGEAVARAHHAALVPVLAWTAPGGDRCADRFLRQEWHDLACQQLRSALTAVWGEVLEGPLVQLRVERGPAGWVLVNVACCPGDLLVVGAGRRGKLARMAGCRVSGYCVAHAGCPVVTVPPPALARDLGHGPLAWVFWHRSLTPDQVLRDQGRPVA